MSTIIKASTYGKNKANLIHALRTLKPFVTGGNLYSFAGNNISHNTGMLSNYSDLKAWEDDYHNDRMLYVVYSYNTPIAWVTRSGIVYHTEQKFSTTTSKHQGLVRAYLTRDSWLNS